MIRRLSNLWNKSIQRQLILGIAMVHAVLMTIFVADLVSRQRSFLIEQSVDQTEAIAKSLAANSISWVLANDVIGLEEVVLSQKDYPNLDYAMVLSPQGKVLAHTDISLVGLFILDSISLRLLAEKPEIRYLIKDEDMIDIGVPIYSDQQHIGWSRIALSQKLLHTGIRKLLRDGLGYTILAIIVGSIFAIFMARSITTGIRHLLTVTRKVQKGETAVRVEEKRADELGELGSSFNNMIDEINRMTQALQKHNEELESRVQDRTAELSGVNQKLREEIKVRIKTGDELKASEEKYSSLFNAMLDGFALHKIVLDKNNQPINYVFLEINAAFEQQTGLKKDDIIGKKVTQALPGIENEAVDWIGQYGSVALSDGELRFEQYSEPLKKWFSILAFSPKLGYFATIFQDITERKQAEKALAESDSLRELLLDIITHDLKNPAGVIYALSETARRDLPENKFMEAIYTSSGRLIEVLNQTTILSQAIFGETIPKAALSLNELLQETVDEFASALSKADMELVVAIAPDLIIKANPLIREVFKNFISNAIKYARDGKKIVIETVIENQAVVVGVKDFGKTLAKADRDRIFERRVQLENGKERGRGLGLAIVKRIAQAHAGEAWVEPNTPMGNSFCIRIPL